MTLMGSIVDTQYYFRGQTLYRQNKFIFTFHKSENWRIWMNRQMVLSNKAEYKWTVERMKQVEGPGKTFIFPDDG